MIRFRRADSHDLEEVRKLAQRFALDTDDMQADQFLLAIHDDKLVGFGWLKKHPDILELGSLGVVKERRGEGVGKMIVEEILERAEDDVYVTTVIPGFFKKLGFKKVPKRPSALERKVAWCKGCRVKECVVMKWNRA